MKNFKKDIACYLSGLMTKEDFIRKVRKGCDARSSDDGYNFDELQSCLSSVVGIITIDEKYGLDANKPEFTNRTVDSYAECKMLVEAFDELAYFKSNDVGKKSDSLFAKGRYIVANKSSYVALLALQCMAAANSGGGRAIMNFYKIGDDSDKSLKDLFEYDLRLAKPKEQKTPQYAILQNNGR